MKGGNTKVVPDGGAGGESEGATLPAASLVGLFRFASGFDLLLMSVGCLFQVVVGVAFSALNVIFGELIDVLSSPVCSVSDEMMDVVVTMLVCAVVFAVAAFIGMYSIPYAAARITNNMRVAYVRAVLRQDCTFFDTAKPGQIVSALSDDTLDFENGISVKLGEGLQAISCVLSGFIIAFYFSWQISLVCCIAVPFMAISAGVSFSSGVGEDGVTGAKAYEAAANVAVETLSSMRTLISFGGEVGAARRYEGHLVGAERAAISQGSKLGLGMGLMWGSFFAMFGLAFWQGGVLVVDSAKDAMDAHPIPINFSSWNNSYAVAQAFCKYPKIGSLGKGDLVDYTEEWFDICACSINWRGIQEQLDSCDEDWAVGLRSFGLDSSDIMDPNCGCGYERGVLSVGAACVSGGRTTMVFFSIMTAGFMLAMIAPALKALGAAQLAAARLYAVIDRVPAFDVGVNSGGSKIDVSGQIGLRGLHFKYPTGERKIFNDINLEVAAGETIALVGESGSGKSTIARLVSRFYDADQGQVTIDGVDIKQHDLLHLRNQIGVVSQEPLLFDISIEENIMLGKPGGASHEEVVAAAKAANAHDFISKFPQGYGTKVGARGSELSGGEKQRVAIARALVRKPRILVLDEATSALDNESERVVQAAIDQLTNHDSEGRPLTTIVIAHRLSTVRNADRIVVLGSKEGTSTAMGSSIVEIGSHEELMNKPNGLYKALVGGPSDDGDAPISASRETAGVTNVGKPESIVDEAVPNDGPKSAETEQPEANSDKEFKDKVNRKRLWAYTKPESGLYALGLFACFLNGFVWPASGIAMALALSAFTNSDFDYATDAINTTAYSFGALAVFSTVVQWAQSYCFEIIGERMTRRLRADYFRILMRQDIGWFDHPANALGVLTARLSVDIKLIRLVVGQGTGATIQSMTSLLAGLVVSLYAAWQFALAFLAVTPLLALSEAINWALMQGGDTLAKKKLGEVSGQFGEYVQGIREVQSFSLEAYIMEDLGKLLEEQIITHSRKVARGRGISAGAVMLIQLGVFALAFWIGAWMQDEGLVDFETINIVIWSMAFGSSGMGIAANWVAKAAEGKAAAIRVFELFDRVSPIDARPWNPDGTERAPATTPPAAIENVRGEVELRGVRFAYPSRKAARVFDGLNLKIPAGQTAALIGSSGSGKSTVMALLERFYDPVSAVLDVGASAKNADEEGTHVNGGDISAAAKAHGSVLLDGVDIRTLDVKFLRSLIGMVGQEPVLFDATVAENIELGRPGATREEIVQAAKAAHAHDFIGRFEGGYDYNVGTRGKLVSGGQKQRIALARTILKNPKILLLDEATSALDNESEKIVQASLDELIENRTSGRTTIIIAHRLSTIRNADCIYVLENKGGGAVVAESGSHDELMKLGAEGKYRALLEAYS